MGVRQAIAWALGLGILLAAFFYVQTVDPLAISARDALAAPSWDAPFGRDAMGRDVLARVLSAARLDLGLALAGTGLALVIGGSLGAVIGWYAGRLWGVGSVLADVLMGFPVYLLALLVVLALGNGLWVVILVTALVNIPLYLRLCRAEVARLRASAVVDGFLLQGVSRAEIARRAIWPEMAPLILAQAGSTLGLSLLNAAGLSFIGVGVQAPQPEWGLMLAEGAREMGAGAWWVVVFPGLALTLAVLVAHRLADWLGGRGRRS